MFLGCLNLVVNDVFSFPPLQIVSELGFKYTFSGVTTQQDRTAESIINGIPAPKEDSNTFSSAFPDYESLDAMWKA